MATAAAVAANIIVVFVDARDTCVAHTAKSRKKPRSDKISITCITQSSLSSSSSSTLQTRNKYTHTLAARPQQHYLERARDATACVCLSFVLRCGCTASVIVCV